MKNPELSAHLVAGRIAGELERRIPHRRAVTKAMRKSRWLPALVGSESCFGRSSNGAEISTGRKIP